MRCGAAAEPALQGRLCRGRRAIGGRGRVRAVGEGEGEGTAAELASGPLGKKMLLRCGRLPAPAGAKR